MYMNKFMSDYDKGIPQKLFFKSFLIVLILCTIGVIFWNLMFKKGNYATFDMIFMVFAIGALFIVFLSPVIFLIVLSVKLKKKKVNKPKFDKSIKNALICKICQKIFSSGYTTCPYCSSKFIEENTDKEKTYEKKI